MHFIHWITGIFLRKKAEGKEKTFNSEIFIEVIFFFKWKDEISNEHNHFRIKIVSFLNSPVTVIVGVCVCVIQFP